MKVGYSGVMDEPIGFLESEFERTLTTMGQAPATGNVVQISDSLRSQATVRERERRFRDLLGALPAAVYTTDAAGRITYYNDAAAELWGHRPPLGTSEWCGSWKLYWPDGTPMAHDECPMAIALKENRSVRGMEAAAERPDGTRVPFIPYPTPIHDEAGKLIGAVNMLVDITDRKRAEEQQALLVRELHHRVKNTLATVQAIMGSTARSVDNIEDFKTAIFGRIQSLAKTHLLLADDVKAVDFADILRSELDAFDSGIGGRITLQGPEVALTSQIAVSLGMAIHELTTNAAKHGALSVYGGKVEVTWSVTIDATRRTLVFDWVESGGPPVKEPTREGFGSRLLDFVLPGQIQARTRVEYAPQGLRVHCSVPLPAETKS
ncbi:MAG TPA: HWE histidine kinase domain-containing protein [Pseudolabrys sp.]|jgi:PAS domain S-box-containing protein|nr:HWE histidine kinase domain-containing protein [Pseudolabrys sp.]